MSTGIACNPCERGITFSSLFDHQRCQKCSQCQPNETLVRHCRPAADAVCTRCAPNQNTWIDFKRETYGCFSCPICSSGFEPSPPCGGTFTSGIMITCKQCQEGETFSSMKDRKQCKRCSSCPPGQRVIVGCTKYSDTVCASPCGGAQITLVKWNKNQTLASVECIDCLTCPEGMEPSVACGTTIKNDVALHCVPCRPGMTYSDLPSKHGCKPCTRCPPGKAVISSCSIHHDTRCHTRCTARQLRISINSTITCVDCVKCSIGMEPEIPCGSLLNAWPRQQCVPCQLGTFSNVYGTEPCVPCRSCPDGMSRCTRISDSICPLCEDKWYHEPVISSCLPCSRCCNDGKDSYPRECAHIKSTKCEVRKCSPTGKTPSSTSAAPSSSLAGMTVAGFVVGGIAAATAAAAIAAAIFVLKHRSTRIKRYISVLGSSESSTKQTKATGKRNCIFSSPKAFI